MKSGLACALSAFAKTAAAVAEGRKLCRRLVFIGSVDEADFMRGQKPLLPQDGSESRIGFWIRSLQTVRFRWLIRADLV